MSEFHAMLVLLTIASLLIGFYAGMIVYK